jgi:hypothetical protein
LLQQLLVIALLRRSGGMVHQQQQQVNSQTNPVEGESRVKLGSLSSPSMSMGDDQSWQRPENDQIVQQAAAELNRMRKVLDRWQSRGDTLTSDPDKQKKVIDAIHRLLDLPENAQVVLQSSAHSGAILHGSKTDYIAGEVSAGDRKLPLRVQYPMNENPPSFILGGEKMWANELSRVQAMVDISREVPTDLRDGQNVAIMSRWKETISTGKDQPPREFLSPETKAAYIAEVAHQLALPNDVIIDPSSLAKERNDSRAVVLVGNLKSATTNQSFGSFHLEMRNFPSDRSVIASFKAPDGRTLGDVVNPLSVDGGRKTSVSEVQSMLRLSTTVDTQD